LIIRFNSRYKTKLFCFVCTAYDLHHKSVLDLAFLDFLLGASLETKLEVFQSKTSRQVRGTGVFNLNPINNLFIDANKTPSLPSRSFGEARLTSETSAWP